MDISVRFFKLLFIMKNANVGDFVGTKNILYNEFMEELQNNNIECIQSEQQSPTECLINPVLVAIGLASMVIVRRTYCLKEGILQRVGVAEEIEEKSYLSLPIQCTSIQNGIDIFQSKQKLERNNNICDKSKKEKFIDISEHIVVKRGGFAILQYERLQYSKEGRMYYDDKGIVLDRTVVLDGKTWELVSVLEHSGSESGGHYKTFSLIQGRGWVLFNDKRLKDADPELYDNKNVYMVMYVLRGSGNQTMVGIDNPAVSCWCNAGIQFLRNIPGLFEYLRERLQKHVLLTDNPANTAKSIGIVNLI